MILDINLDLVNVDIDLDHLGLEHSPEMLKPFSDDVPLNEFHRTELTRRWMAECGATPEEIDEAISEDELYTIWAAI